jgi:hypothetical protein
MIVSRLLCTDAVGSHGSCGTRLAMVAPPLVSLLQAMRPGFRRCKAGEARGLRPLVSLAVVEHNYRYGW